VGYTVDVDPIAQEQIAVFPPESLRALAEALAVLQVTPWNGESVNRKNPDGAVRRLIFGAGCFLTYLILEDQRRLDLLSITWLD
jgi:hypothetical protein